MPGPDRARAALSRRQAWQRRLGRREPSKDRNPDPSPSRTALHAAQNRHVGSRSARPDAAGPKRLHAEPTGRFQDAGAQPWGVFAATARPARRGDRRGADHRLDPSSRSEGDIEASNAPYGRAPRCNRARSVRRREARELWFGLEPREELIEDGSTRPRNATTAVTNVRPALNAAGSCSRNRSARTGLSLSLYTSRDSRWSIRASISSVTAEERATVGRESTGRQLLRRRRSRA